VLTNSTLNIPASITLARAIAQKCYLTTSTTSTNEAYVQLPPFLTMTGTLGNPQKHLETTALVKYALQQAAAQGAGGKGAAGQVLQGVNTLFGGSSSTNSTGTNPAGGKASSLLNSVLGGSATNSGATNQTPVKNLLKGFLK
jgi:hypothetical protein